MRTQFRVGVHTWKTDKMNYILYQVAERVCTITLNRPEKKNALNFDMVTQLHDSLVRAMDDKDVKAVLLKGNGDAFCAGADLAYIQSLQTNTYEENLTDSQHVRRLYELMYTFPKITVASVRGPALAGGSGLVSACDFAIAEEGATFGYTEVRIGFIPALVMVILRRKLGESKLREWLLSGEIFTAHKALHDGLLYKVCPANALDSEVQRFMEHICKKLSADSIALTKKLMHQIDGVDLTAAFGLAAEANAKARDTDDCKKGIAAFLNKEKLVW